MSADKIRDPLEDAATTGVIGGKRPSFAATGRGQHATGRQGQADQEKKTEREKRTLMFTPERAKWLKVQAALEGREMSEIVEEALEHYQRLHPQSHM